MSGAVRDAWGKKVRLPMNRVLAYLIRFAIIIIGYAVAALAASAFLNVVSWPRPASPPKKRRRLRQAR